MSTTASETVTRFAPSPTGLLHLGHAHAALFAWRRARRAGGRFLLRIDDLDGPRCRPEFEAAILEDLAWLGLDWDGPVYRQSEHGADYAGALARLEGDGLLYPCFCTRKEIRAEIEAAAQAPHGPLENLYPGTCRGLNPQEVAARRADGRPFALRLDSVKAAERGGTLTWRDLERGVQTADPRSLGDVVLARKEVATSYHLSVVLDDAAQGVTLVTRGADLFEATHVHRLLQALLGLPVPVWQHHRLIAGPDGERLAKRSDSASLRHLRETGRGPAEVRALAGFPG